MSPVRNPEKVLVVQTAFLGDVILTLPLVQTLKREHPAAEIDLLVIPGTSEVLRNHPAIREVIVFDKRGAESGIGGFLRKAGAIRKSRYDTALLPHRSVRSASLALVAGIPRRVGFRSSAARTLLTDAVEYDPGAHEIDRNLALLRPLGIVNPGTRAPELYPSETDCDEVNGFLKRAGIPHSDRLVAIAPGTVWNTKRWPPDRFAGLAERLLAGGWSPVVIGGANEGGLLTPHLSRERGGGVVDAAGRLTILQSAELIRRCRALVTNDSAPMHLAVAVRTPVVAIFGATIPEFGFAPIGARDIVLETKGLACRPCSIHGGERCPIKTFECMLNITVDRVLEAVEGVAGEDTR